MWTHEEFERELTALLGDKVEFKYIEGIAYLKINRKAKTLENAVDNTFRQFQKIKSSVVFSCQVVADVEGNGSLEPAIIVGRY